ncbi:unnamed protein product [Oppiella nova]|uniref:Elongation of very long chain fatty acids protein n=1 Tax=Oppiella nova TaxID=334625 RepID=A0A7R9LB45_9ACAR|nr:unnamed protein product [Oppiella nova]CAG2161724.1 unnamed protein product [Oppiella nova]
MLILWNCSLAVFSILGTVRCLPQFWHLYYTKGFMATVCQSDYYKDIRVLWWYNLFVWSKIAELIDTLLIRLHWIHHVTLCYCWYSIGEYPGTYQWMVTMNFGVHSIMYTYYALKAMRVRIARTASIAITLLQIMQMIAGFYVNYVAIDRKMSGQACDVFIETAKFGVTIYTLFLVLFMNFFVKTYILSKNNAKHRIKHD